MNSLGRQLASEFHLDKHRSEPDVLSNWLGQHIASLLDQADSATTAEERTEANERARVAILDAWAARRHWPKAWPPEDAVALLSALERPTSITYGLAEDPSPTTWQGGFIRLERLQRDESMVMVYGFLVGQPAASERWAKQALVMDRSEEEVLRRFAGLREEAKDFFRKATGKSRPTKAERLQAISDEMSRLANERAQLLAGLQ